MARLKKCQLFHYLILYLPKSRLDRRGGQAAVLFVSALLRADCPQFAGVSSRPRGTRGRGSNSQGYPQVADALKRRATWSGRRA